MNNRSERGFTLIEVMIVVAIIAILAGVALPSYRDYVRRGQLPDAFTYLSDYRVKMEQYYQDNRNYGKAGGDPCANGDVAPTWKDFNPNSKYFTFTCTVGADNQHYTLTATGSSAQAAGHDYTINEAGLKKTIKFKGAAVDKSCWLTTGSEC